MSASTEIENLEYLFLELIGEFRSISSSDAHFREAVRAEATRAERAEAALATAQRAAAEAGNSAAAAVAAATHSANELFAAVEQRTALQMQLELAERQRAILEEKCAEMCGQLKSLERELQQLRPLQTTYASLQRQYTEMQERIVAATQEARMESSRLESELRRVSKCAAGGGELRERARLAAAAHARDRRLAAHEMRHTATELHAANAEISRLSFQVAELQLRLAQDSSSKELHSENPDTESLAEVRAALEAERVGTEKLEKALAAALANNATLAAQFHDKEAPLNQAPVSMPPSSFTTTNICPIDSFLAE